MIQQTETYYCDRCGKEMDKPCYTKVDVKIKRFRRKRLVTRWNADYRLFEPCDLCKACAASFDEWWKGGEA